VQRVVGGSGLHGDVELSRQLFKLRHGEARAEVGALIILMIPELAAGFGGHAGLLGSDGGCLLKVIFIVKSGGFF
jgi:hypothetical protein